MSALREEHRVGIEYLESVTNARAADPQHEEYRLVLLLDFILTLGQYPSRVEASC
jgi:hypothetical protein